MEFCPEGARITIQVMNAAYPCTLEIYQISPKDKSENTFIKYVRQSAVSR